MDKPTTDKGVFKCHERRHMTGAVYKTYDAIRAMAESAYSGVDEDGNPKPKRQPGEPLAFYATVSLTLVNHTNTSSTQLDDHIKKLCNAGWLHKCEPPDGGARERNVFGHLKPVMYIVLDHADYRRQYPDRKCPPMKGETMTEKTAEPIRFQMAKALDDPAGRAALIAARLAGQLPGKTWDEIMANLEAHPENMPKRLARKSGRNLARKN